MDFLYLGICTLILAAAIFANAKAHGGGPFFPLALAIWFASEIATSFSSSIWASTGYVLFYPLIFIAIPHLFEIDQRGEAIRLLDGAVLVLGSSTIASAILLRSIEADFLHILYPLSDLVVLIAVLVVFMRRAITGKSLLVLLGFLLYFATDFIYLIQVANSSYKNGSLLKYGWVVSFALITLSQYRRGIRSEPFPPIPLFYLGISVLSSALMLTMIALKLYKIPNFVIGPALMTLLFSFLRLALALKQSEVSAKESNLAKLDDLTGLPNRRWFIADLEKFKDGSIILMDLDGFKPVNDQFGHEVGNEILRQVSGRFQRAISENALLARLGGDEFAVLTHEDYESAMELAMALRATLSYPFNVGGNQIKVDVSIGCVVNDGRQDILARADTAMYQAKKLKVGVWANGT